MGWCCVIAIVVAIVHFLEQCGGGVGTAVLAGGFVPHERGMASFGALWRAER